MIFDYANCNHTVSNLSVPLVMLFVICINLIGLAWNSQEVIVPPVEGEAGGGTSYGWSDAGVYVSSLMKGAIDPSEVASSDLLHVWCMPNTVNVGSQEMPRILEQVCLLYLIFGLYCGVLFLELCFRYCGHWLEYK